MVLRGIVRFVFWTVLIIIALLIIYGLGGVIQEWLDHLLGGTA